jgi:putative oxidoreductase
MTVTDACLLVLRLAVGLTFAAHGAQKAFGWWSGPGPARWRGAVGSMGFAPAGFFGIVSIGIELGAGLLLALGLLTPLVAAALVAQAIVIVIRVHWSKGFFSTAGGFEHPLLLGLVAAVVCLLGPGGLSLDEAAALHLDLTARMICLVAGVVVGAATAALPVRAAERLARGGLRRT